MTLAKVYVNLRSGDTYCVFETPTQLAETERIEIVVPLDDFRHSIAHPLDMTAFDDEDSAGKRYRYRTSRIANEIRAVWAPDVNWLTKTKLPS